MTLLPPLTQKTSAEEAVLQTGVPTAKGTWPHAAQTSSERGVSDLISDASSVHLWRVSTCP